MLDDVLAALRDAGVVDVRILAGDAAASAAAADRDLRVVADPAPGSAPGADPVTVGAGGDRSLRAAVDAALAGLPGTATRLVVVADLPCLRASEIITVLTDPSDVAVAPTSGGGTALLRLAPGVIIPTRYGSQSAQAHAAEAHRAGHSCVLLELPGAHHDVDAAADLAALEPAHRSSMLGAATTAFLAHSRGYPHGRFTTT